MQCYFDIGVDWKLLSHYLVFVPVPLPFEGTVELVFVKACLQSQRFRQGGYYYEVAKCYCLTVLSCHVDEKVASLLIALSMLKGSLALEFDGQALRGPADGKKICSVKVWLQKLVILLVEITLSLHLTGFVLVVLMMGFVAGLIVLVDDFGEAAYAAPEVVCVAQVVNVTSAVEAVDTAAVVVAHVRVVAAFAGIEESPLVHLVATIACDAIAAVGAFGWPIAVGVAHVAHLSAFAS